MPRVSTLARLALVLAAGAFTVGLTACDTVNSPGGGRADLLPASAYPRVVVTQPLDEELVFGPAIVTPGTPSKPIWVSQPVRNTDDDRKFVQYRFEWFDAHKRPRGDSGWRFKELGSRNEVFLEAGATDTDVADWRILIKPAR